MTHTTAKTAKSPYDDDFKADACPAHTAACQKKSYLVAGDLVLLGKTQGDFTCVDYQSLLATKQVWTIGWLPSAALTPVAPMLAPKTSDWVGTWYHPGGSIEIKSGKRDILDVEGGMRADRKRFSQWRVQGAGYTQERHCGVCRRRHELRRRMPRAITTHRPMAAGRGQ